MEDKNEEFINETQETSKNLNVSGIEDDMSKALNMIIGKNNGHSFKDCRDKSREIGWGTTSPLHKMALVVFCESETYREAWMQLHGDVNEDWVRMIGNKLRLEP